MQGFFQKLEILSFWHHLHMQFTPYILPKLKILSF